MENHSKEILLMGVLLNLLLCWFTMLSSAMEMTKLTLDSREVCREDLTDVVYWASKKKSVIVVGRGAYDRQLYRDCGVVIGAATAEANILQLHFEAFHIQDCGVVVSVNQSSHSDFRKGSTVLAKIGCKHGSLDVLYSQEKHYVKISVEKDNILLRQYNFRINVTVIDKLPEKGPKTHDVIIVGVVVLVVVGMAMCLLVKYLIRRTQRWQEHCAERNMERAIRLYNNQESPPESDYMYTALPPQQVDVGRVALPSHRNGHCHPSKNAKARSSRHRAGNISFVHADGHIETFRMHDSPQERRSGDSDHNPAATTPRSAHLAPLAGDRDAESVMADSQMGEDVLGECPPSYEEALQMPTPHDPRSPLYVNLDSKKDDNHTT